MRFKFTLDKKEVLVEAAPMDILSHVLREKLGYISLNEYCNTERCGGCTVLKNGYPVPACSIHMFSVNGSKIETFDFIQKSDEFTIIEQALKTHKCTFCEYCKHGKIVTLYWILKKFTKDKHTGREKTFSEDEIYNYFSSNICTCTDLQTMMSIIKTMIRNYYKLKSRGID